MCSQDPELLADGPLSTGEYDECGGGHIDRLALLIS
jgi:hypothetical protein